MGATVVALAAGARGRWQQWSSAGCHWPVAARPFLPSAGRCMAGPMPKLTSAIDPKSPAFAANADVNRALAETLRARVAQAAVGGPEAARTRHTARGKLL